MVNHIKTIIVETILSTEMYQITRSTLLRKLWAHYTAAKEIDDVMKRFEDAGLVSSASIGRDTLYTMPPQAIKEYKRLFKMHKKNE